MAEECPTYVVYDADCEVCRAFRRWAKARDRRQRLTFVSNSDPSIAELGDGVDPARAARSLAVVLPGGRVRWGAWAVFVTVGALPGYWGVAGRVLGLPPLRWLAEPLYRLFARHRGRFARFVRRD